MSLFNNKQENKGIEVIKKEPKDMKEKIDEMYSLVESYNKKFEGKKRKKEILPPKVKSSAKKKILQGYVLVLRATPTGMIIPEWVKPQNGMIYLKKADNYYDFNSKYVMTFAGKYPCIFLPEWRNTPMCPQDQRIEDEESGNVTDHQKFLIKVMHTAQLAAAAKGAFGNKKIIFFFIIGLVGMIAIGAITGWF